MNKEKNFATANYNMAFDNGSFKKDRRYQYQKSQKSKNNIEVITEEGNIQSFYFSEFDMLFSI